MIVRTRERDEGGRQFFLVVVYDGLLRFEHQRRFSTRGSADRLRDSIEHAVANGQFDPLNTQNPEWWTIHDNTKWK